MNPIDNGNINYKHEVIRKLIHFNSLSIPIVYYYISQRDAIIILSVMTFLALVLDIGRYYSSTIANAMNGIFGVLFRKHELDSKKKNLNGATYVLLSALVCVIIFPKVLFITAFSILIISDSMAALIGRKFGRNKFLAKSFEGSLAFFLSAAIVVFFTPKVLYSHTEYVIAIAAALVGTIIENISFGFADDNFAIPVSIGFTMWLLYYFIYPDLPLILTSVPQ